MPAMHRLSHCGLTLALLSACGPSIMEHRTAFVPARERNCKLEHVTTTMADFAPDGRYEVIGNIMLVEGGRHGPFDPEYLAEVDPRACAMGGDAVTVTQAASSSTGLSAGSNIQYSVLKEKPRTAIEPPGEETGTL